MQDKPTWGFLLRIALKAALLFALCNVTYALANPIQVLGRLSLYNVILPGRERLPYGENPAQSYNLSLFNIPAMFASHIISRPPADDEFRVLILGDSSAWGWLLHNDATLAAQINAGDYHTTDGRHIVAHNLAYPIMSLTKDLMLLDEAMAYQPDMIVWLVTLDSFPRDQQLFPPIVQQNAPRVRRLIDTYDLALNSDDSRLVNPTFLDQTIIGQRRALADLVRLQFYGFSWAATGIDQAIPAEITLRRSDFEADITWRNYSEPLTLTEDDLALDVLSAGVEMAGEIPILIVNEPMFISNGQNSDLHYNSLYPRWAYDSYRELLSETAQSNGWHYLDLWDAIAAEEFTDSPVHLTPAGTLELARIISDAIMERP